MHIKTLQSGDKTAEFSNHLLHVLHIEADDIDARQLAYYAHAIDDMDIMIHRCRSIHDARKKFDYRHFDLCIVDISLRTRSYLSVINEISHFQDNLPVIILSHMTNDLFVDESIISGADYFLGKGELSVATLSQAIEQALNGNGLFRQRRPCLISNARRPGSSGAHGYNSRFAAASPSDTRMPPQNKPLTASLSQSSAPQDEPPALILTSQELEQLRSEVTTLHYELNTRLNIIPQERRSRNRSILYVADLISNSIRASMPIFERKLQSCCFDDYNSDILCTADPIDTMIIMAEMLNIMARDAKSKAHIRIRLEQDLGRTAVSIQAAAPPSAAQRDDMAEYADRFFRPGQFSYSRTQAASGDIRMVLEFPFLLN